MPEETGWICPRCGHSNTRTPICAECGERLTGPRSTPRTHPAGRRVNESEVARILGLIANPPNLREHPNEGDVPGNFQAWFDGGAIRVDTGTKTYFLADGTRILLLAPVTWLSAEIRFPDGNLVIVRQVKESHENGD